jgi:hypothetical protein
MRRPVRERPLVRWPFRVLAGILASFFMYAFVAGWSLVLRGSFDLGSAFVLGSIPSMFFMASLAIRGRAIWKGVDLHPPPDDAGPDGSDEPRKSR